MAWTTPRTWVTGELVTAALMNTHVRDNLQWVKDAMAGVVAINPVFSSLGADGWGAIQTTGASTTSFLALYGRVASVNSTWLLVSAGAGLGTPGLRVVQGTWTNTPVATFTIGDGSTFSYGLGIGTTSPGMDKTGSWTNLSVIGTTTASDLGCVQIGCAGVDGSGSSVGQLEFVLGSQSALHKRLAAINCGTVGGTANQRGGRLDFATKANGSTTATNKLRIFDTGTLDLSPNGALATTATDGFTYIPSCAGAPTGVPTAQGGKAMVYDSTNLRLYIYGTAWKSVLLA